MAFWTFLHFKQILSRYELFLLEHFLLCFNAFLFLYDYQFLISFSSLLIISMIIFVTIVFVIVIVIDGNFEHCLLNLFFWRSSFEVTLLYFALDNYFFYSVFFNLDLLCCWVICIFVCNFIIHWQSFWKEEKYL